MNDSPIVAFASNLTEVFQALKNIPNMRIFNGCTTIKKIPYQSQLNLPHASLFVGGLTELKEIKRTERFIECGSGVTLNQILNLGTKRLPSFLHEAILSVANHRIRNSATMGGNICFTKHKLSLVAPLLAIDTSLDFKNFHETQNIPLSKLQNIPQNFILTKLIIPIQHWDVEIFYRLGPKRKISPLSASFTFLADTKRGILSDLRIAFAGLITFRSRELEHTLIGAKLPLVDKDINVLKTRAQHLFEAQTHIEKKHCPLILKRQFLNLLEYSLFQLM